MQGLAELRQNRHLPLKSALDIMYLNDNLSQEVQLVKNSPVNAGDTGDTGLIPGSGRSPGGRRGNPLLSSRLEDPMDRGAWWATVHGVAESSTRQSTHKDRRFI